MICQMIGIFLYCGQATQPLATFPQSTLPSPQYVDSWAAVLESRDRDARSTPLQQLIDCGKRNDSRPCTRK